MPRLNINYSSLDYPPDALQNELFQEQLRTDPELAAYLAADPAAAEVRWWG